MSARGEEPQWAPGSMRDHPSLNQVANYGRRHPMPILSLFRVVCMYPIPQHMQKTSIQIQTPKRKQNKILMSQKRENNSRKQTSKLSGTTIYRDDWPPWFCVPVFLRHLYPPRWNRKSGILCLPYRARSPVAPEECSGSGGGLCTRNSGVCTPPV